MSSFDSNHTLPEYVTEIVVDPSLDKKIKNATEFYYNNTSLNIDNSLHENQYVKPHVAFHYKDNIHHVIKNFLISVDDFSDVQLFYYTNDCIFITDVPMYNIQAVYEYKTKILYIRNNRESIILNSLNIFNNLTCKYKDLFNQHLSNTREVNIGSFLGTKQIVHHYFNELSGLWNVTSNITLHTIFAQFEYYGCIQEIFGERLSETDILRNETPEKIFLKTCYKNIFFIKHTENYVPKDLNDRIITYALKQNAPKHNKCFLFTLRVSHRKLKNQIEFITTCIHEFEKRYPNSLYLIDGVTKLHRTRHDDMHDHVRAERRIFKEIIKNTKNLNVQSILFQDINTFIQYAQIVDFYIANIGTCQHKLGYFSRAKGVVHGGGINRHAEVSDQGWYWESHFGQVCRRMSNDFFKYDNINDYNSNYIADLELVKEWAKDLIIW
jgi:hypothetical protein